MTPALPPLAAEERVGAYLPPSKLLEATSLPTNMKAAYSSGPDIGSPDTGRIVAYAVRVRATLKVGDREFSGDICLHDTVMLRRFYEELGSGSVVLAPEWVPYLQRIVPLTQEQLQRELTRLLENYIVPRANGATVVPAIFLGTEPAEQLKRLHSIMQRQLSAWSALVDSAAKRVPHPSKDPAHALAQAFEAITARELEDVAGIADPGRDGAGTIELPEVLLPTAPLAAAAAAPSPAPSPEEVHRLLAAEELVVDAAEALITRLTVKAGLTQQQALGVAAVVEVAAGGELSDTVLLDAAGPLSKTKLDAVRRALKG